MITRKAIKMILNTKTRELEAELGEWALQKKLLRPGEVLRFEMEISNLRVQGAVDCKQPKRGGFTEGEWQRMKDAVVHCHASLRGSIERLYQHANQPLSKKSLGAQTLLGINRIFEEVFLPYRIVQHSRILEKPRRTLYHIVNIEDYDLF